jgi:cobalt/nickel transport system permease protein
MHIPDNYLSPATCAVMGAAMVPVWAVAVAKIKKEITSAKKIPLLGISAAFSFLVMMLNVPLPGGTTGHAVGASIIAILLGPFSACLTVTIALLIQALFFGDGGILSFGANCFNMAFVMPFVTYFIFNLFCKFFKNEKMKYVAAFIAAYISINIAAFFAAVEFGIQPLLFKDAAGLPMYSPYPLSISIPAMLIPHLLVAGFAEAFITVGVYAYVSKMSPGIIYEEKEVKYKWLYILIFALIIICPLGLLAPGTAWGEWAADEIKEMVKFIPSGMKNGINFETIMPDYNIPVLNNEIISYIISAIVGVALLLIIFKVVSAIFKKKSDSKE